jgi:hypothetical protein
VPTPTTDWRAFVEQALAEGTAYAVGVNGLAVPRGDGVTLLAHRGGPPPRCPEKVFQAHARALFAWGRFPLFYHTLRSTGSGEGFPDCVAGGRRPGELVVAELKVGRARPTAA